MYRSTLALLLVLTLTDWTQGHAEISDGAWTKQRVGQEVQQLTLGVEKLVRQLDRLYVKPSAVASVYVRWGSSSCPDGTETVYEGVVGGGHFSHGGDATNALCLPPDPVYDKHDIPTYVAYLYGAEYETTPQSPHDLDVVCAVCRTADATTLMVPGTNTCRPGWSRQYSGYLMAGYHTHAIGSQYYCIDKGLEVDDNSVRSDNGKLFYYVVGQCGSLPCPPYKQDGIVTCVVCSK